MPIYRDDLAAAHDRIADLEEEVRRLREELDVAPEIRVKRTELDAAQRIAEARHREAVERAKRIIVVVTGIFALPGLAFVLWLVSLGKSGHPFAGFVITCPIPILAYLVARSATAKRVRAADLDLLEIERQRTALENSPLGTEPGGRRLRVGTPGALTPNAVEEAEEPEDAGDDIPPARRHTSR